MEHLDILIIFEGYIANFCSNFLAFSINGGQTVREALTGRIISEGSRSVNRG